MTTAEIPLVENVPRANDEIAARNRADLDAIGVRAVNLMGAAGCGKTSWLMRTLEALPDLEVGIIAADPSTTRDAERLAEHTPHVTQINTGPGCHLEAHQVRHGMENLQLDALDLLFVENVGDLVCPGCWDLGEHRRVVMFSVAEGDDQPAKHPSLLEAADFLLLAKTDLAAHVPFDVRRFHADLQAIRAELPVLEVSATSGTGLERWVAWLRALVASP